MGSGADYCGCNSCTHYGCISFQRLLFEGLTSTKAWLCFVVHPQGGIRLALQRLRAFEDQRARAGEPGAPDPTGEMKTHANVVCVLAKLGQFDHPYMQARVLEGRVWKEVNELWVSGASVWGSDGSGPALKTYLPPLTGAARGSARARLQAAARCAAPVALQPHVGSGQGGPQPETAAQRQPEGDVGGGCGQEGRGSRVTGRGQRGVGQRAGSQVPSEGSGGRARGQRFPGTVRGQREAGQNTSSWVA